MLRIWRKGTAMTGFWKRLAPGLAGLLALAGAPAAPDPAPDRVGLAYGRDSGAFLYSQAHFEEVREGRLAAERVVYRGPDGELLAEKRLDYRPSAFAPRFELAMAVNAYREDLRQGPEGLRVFYRPANGGRTYAEPLADAADLVADGGFDRVVAARFGDLRAGRTLSFDFLVPGRLTTYPFRVWKVGDTRVLGEPAVHLRMEPAHLLLRWLAEPVDVFHHRDQGRLLRYLGPTNLRDRDGDNPPVRVDFPAQPPARAELNPAGPRTSPFLTGPTDED